MMEILMMTTVTVTKTKQVLLIVIVLLLMVMINALFLVEGLDMVLVLVIFRCYPGLAQLSHVERIRLACFTGLLSGSWARGKMSE